MVLPVGYGTLELIPSVILENLGCAQWKGSRCTAVTFRPPWVWLPSLWPTDTGSQLYSCVLLVCLCTSAVYLSFYFFPPVHGVQEQSSNKFIIVHYPCRSPMGPLSLVVLRVWYLYGVNRSFAFPLSLNHQCTMHSGCIHDVILSPCNTLQDFMHTLVLPL